MTFLTCLWDMRTVNIYNSAQGNPSQSFANGQYCICTERSGSADMDFPEVVSPPFMGPKSLLGRDMRRVPDCQQPDPAPLVLEIKDRGEHSRRAKDIMGGPKSWGHKKVPKDQNLRNFCSPPSGDHYRFEEPVPLLQTTIPPSALQCKPLACCLGQLKYASPDYIHV